MVSTAFAIAAKAHEGVVNKDGTAYILHPARLATRCADQDHDAQTVAILHDVIEDTPVTLDDLWVAEFPSRLIEAIDAMTKREGEEYGDFIERIALNPLAARIKILDIEDNIDVLRLPVVGEWELQRTAKYHRAWKRLKEAQKANAA